MEIIVSCYFGAVTCILIMSHIELNCINRNIEDIKKIVKGKEAE